MCRRRTSLVVPGVAVWQTRVRRRGICDSSIIMHQRRDEGRDARHGEEKRDEDAARHPIMMRLFEDNSYELAVNAGALTVRYGGETDV